MMDDECHTFAIEVVGNHISWNVDMPAPQSAVRRNIHKNQKLVNTLTAKCQQLYNWDNG